MIAPLDLQTILVNTLAGNWYIFTAIILFVVAGLAARFRMPNIIFGMSVLLFAAIMAAQIIWLWWIVILITLMIIGYQLVRIVGGK